ncbi:hypothetical protein [Bacillus sp. RAR_GA_16]|uniref:hypothetical protein n=1 Tax=Bacillus sp. RAR_GA_16 TaxID=2876774 RepID=UPI001CCE01EC|nr:hypothetical protein [Bacillus sp. RAR_GA_16]MCA0171301.1 hypothetical protein [Bacillus sp. RAR_GA_16]
MNRSSLSSSQLSMAKSLLKQAIDYQKELEKSEELIKKAAPVEGYLQAIYSLLKK